MQYYDDQLSVLSFGCQTSRRAWQILSQPSAPLPDLNVLGELGRELDRLAFDLKRLGHGKPARLATSAALVLTGLASQSIPFDMDLLDGTARIVAVLAQMLLELESSSLITCDEPVEIVNQLHTRWGLTATSDGPRPLLAAWRHDDTATPVGQHDLAAVCHELVEASQSLLNKALADDGFAFTAAVGRIHHLAMSIRDHVLETALEIQQPMSTVPPLPDEPVAIAAGEPMEAPMQSDPVVDPASIAPRTRRLRVLVVDDSPFVRLLLTTAMEATGILTVSAMPLSDVEMSCTPDAWDLVIGDAADLARPIPSQEWLSGQIAAGTLSAIGLVNAPGSSDASTRIPHVCRTDLPGLMRLVKATLGVALTTSA